MNASSSKSKNKSKSEDSSVAEANGEVELNQDDEENRNDDTENDTPDQEGDNDLEHNDNLLNDQTDSHLKKSASSEESKRLSPVSDEKESPKKEICAQDCGDDVWNYLSILPSVLPPSPHSADQLDALLQVQSDHWKWPPPQMGLFGWQQTAKAVAASVKPTRRYQSRASMLARHRDLSQERKRLLNAPSVGRPSSLTPLLLKEGTTLGGLLTEIPDYYTDGGETIVAEVAVQFLNAQVRVLKDELQRVIQDCVEKEEMVILLEKRLKETEQERNKLNRENSTKQQLVEKYQRVSDENKTRGDKLESQCASLKKECEILKQGQKQVVASKGTVEARLNRALEEIEKLKGDLRQTRQAAKETSETDKRKIDDMSTENRRLEKQKSELLTAFKKQMKLIDNLKRQKMHLEAAKALQFTEEEFMRALDWGT